VTNNHTSTNTITSGEREHGNPSNDTAEAQVWPP